MKTPDPRLKRAEKMLTEALRLIAEIKSGVAPPRRRRRRRRRPKHDQAAILRALREGADFRAPAESRDPRLPGPRVLRQCRHADPAFDHAVAVILRERQSKYRGLAAHPGASVAAKRQPGQKHDWDTIAAKIEAGATIGPKTRNRQGLPSHTLIMARRKADPEFARAMSAALARRFGDGRRGTGKPFDRESVLELIRRGAVIKACPPEPGMPSKARIDNLRKSDPAFNMEVQAAIVEARRRKVNLRALRKAGKDAAWRAADDAVPKTLDPDLRGDIVGELALRLTEGVVGRGDDLQKAWRTCRTRLNRDRWKEVSLDAPIAGTDGLRRIDLLAAEPG